MSRPVYRFATYRLDVAARELHARGALLDVSPKVFDGLVWLIEHRDRAVGRDELIAAIWGRADVTDAQLSQLMRKLRRTVGDAGEGQAMVRTIPRFGYRWVADTQVVDASDPIAVETPAPTTPARARRSRMTKALVATAALAVLVAAGAAGWWRSHTGTAAAKDVIAVLPVAVDPDADRESAWLRLGLMDRIADDLREAGLRVVPSDNIAAASRNDGTPLLGEQRVESATGAAQFVVASVRHVANGWICRIEWREKGRVRREVEARADDAVEAAHRASLQLLVALGKPTVEPRAGLGDTSAANWLQRIDVAMLDADPALARTLLDTAPASLHSTPAWLLRRADLDLATERMAAAKQGYLELLARVPEIDATTHARALIGLSGPVAQEGDLAGAQQRLGEAIGLLRGQNAPQFLGEALYGRGMFAMVQGDLDRADADFSQARIAFELGGASLQLARLEGQQANLLAARNRHAEALAAWSEAADRFERFGDAGAFVDALGNAATEQLALVQPRAAQATIARAGPWLARLDHPLSAALFRYVGARVQAQNGQLRAAREQFTALRADAATAQIAGMDATLQLELAQLDYDGGDAAAAAREAQAAMAGLLEPGLASPVYARIRNGGWLLLVRALRTAGRDEQAALEVRRFASAAGTDDAGTIYARLIDAEAEWGADRAAGARAYAESLAAARRVGSPAEIVDVVLSYGAALLGAGDVVAATTVAGQAGACAEQDFRCAVLQARLYLALRQPEAFARAIGQVRALAGERVMPADLLAAERRVH
ncbi:winged helix-turn-helix domain-containing protein [Dokdonella sp.]|uniref:winged helix-turn-helix domain-containing protein n=1 Tax=Dokdonella sp. TaxID=2291710 RepID=UPI002F3F6623